MGTMPLRRNDYKRGYNYKRVYEAALADPSIKSLGLTEACLQLRLVTRKAKTPADEQGDGKPESSNAGATQTGDKAGASGLQQHSDLTGC